MCESSVKLIAWLDQELPVEEAAKVARHVEVCTECRSQIELCRQLNESVDAYCNAAITSKAKRRSKLLAWRPGYAVAALAAASVLLFFLSRPDEYLRSPFRSTHDASAIALKTPALPVPALEKMGTAPMVAVAGPKRTALRRSQHRTVPQTAAPNRNANWLPNEAPVHIAIPADALFPPGTFPEGVGFVADVNWRPDGSAQRLRLQPQLVGFQMRGARP